MQHKRPHRALVFVDIYDADAAANLAIVSHSDTFFCCAYSTDCTDWIKFYRLK